MIKQILIFGILLSCVDYSNAQSFDKENDGLTLFTQFGLNVLKTKEREKPKPDGGSETIDLLDGEVEFLANIEFIGNFFVIPGLLAVGPGLGLDIDFRDDYYAVPLFFDLRYFFYENFSSPYLYLDYGGFVDFGGKFNRGQLLNFGTGYTLPTEGKLWLVLDVRYSVRFLSLNNERVSLSEDTLTYRGWQISLGLRF